jgi:membrane protease YdiL (CAAX protease family)
VRSFALLGLVLAVLAFTAVASPWVAWEVEALTGRSFTFSRVYDRVFQVLLVVGVLVAWGSLDLGRAADIGFRRQGWRRDLGRGLLAGIGGLGLALVVCGLLGGLTPDLRYPFGKTITKLLLGAAAAVAIGVGEEALFRGVLLRRFARDAGMAVAVAGSTAIYAMVHVLRVRGGPDAAHALSGIEQTAKLFSPLVNPAALPQIGGLALLGLVLVAARLRTGSLWMAIGMHAAFVAVFRIGRLFFHVADDPDWLVGGGWPPLIGGLTGWLGVAATAWLAFGRRR